MTNPSCLATDSKGYTYASKQELCDGIEFLDEDADYLERQVDKYRDKAIKDRIRSNAAHSKAWADELRNLMTRYDLERLQRYNRALNTAYERLINKCAQAEHDRDAALEREAALAAHVERIIEARNSNRGDTLANICAVIDEATHQTSLARRDLIKQAEALDELEVALKQCGYGASAQGTRVRANAKRQQAEATQ